MAKTNKEFVSALYLMLLDKVAEPLVIDYYATRLDAGLLTRSGMVYNAITGSEYNIAAEKLTRLYLATFNRLPDYDGFLFWLGVHRNGGSDGMIAQTFAQSDEFVTKYGKNLSNEQYLDQIYSNVLGRNADAAGKAYWLNEMANGVSRGLVLGSFAQSAEFIATTQTKVNASILYATLIGRMPTNSEVSVLPTQLDQMVVKVAQATELPQVFGAISYSSTVLRENANNDGTIVGQLVLTLSNDTFKGVVGDSLGKVTNVPTGLSASLTKASDTTAILKLNGTASSNASANNVSNLTVTLDNTVFTGGKAANITNATKTDLQINYIDFPFFEGQGLLTGKGSLTTSLSIDLLSDKILLDSKAIDLLLGTMSNVNSLDLSTIAPASSSSTGSTGTSKVSVTIKGDAAANSILASAYPNTIDSGAGNDQITLGAAVDTLVFGILPADNGVDTIKGFTIGKGGDVLNFSAFLNKTGVSRISAVNATSVTPKSWANGDVLTVQGNSMDAAKIADLFGAAKAFSLPTAAAKAVIITADIIGDASIWYIINQNDVGNITADEVTLVGVLKNINNLTLSGFDTTNFA